MKRILISFLFVSIFACLANAQTQSITGTVIDTQQGMYKWAAIVIRVDDGKRYLVYTLSGDYPTPQTIGRIDEVGRRVQVFYNKILQPSDYDGDVVATKILEIKKSLIAPNEKHSDACNFCGDWEYYDRESQSKHYLRIIKAAPDKFRLIPGYVGVNGQIAWQDNEASGLVIRNADGIYLRPVNRKIVGTFASINFQATGGSEFTYRIICEIKPHNKMTYTVSSLLRGRTIGSNRHDATKVGS
jgi:hypothetical protein